MTRPCFRRWPTSSTSAWSRPPSIARWTACELGRRPISTGEPPFERELSLIEAREQRLVEGIARGDRMDPLLAQLKAEESRKSALTHELAALVDQGRLASLETRRLRQELTRQATHVRELLARREPGARKLLQTLLVDRLGFTPFEENGVRGYRFGGQATYGGLLAGLGIATSDGVHEGNCSP